MANLNDAAVEEHMAKVEHFMGVTQVRERAVSSIKHTADTEQTRVRVGDGTCSHTGGPCTYAGWLVDLPAL
jgi:hypothetical protein